MPPFAHIGPLGPIRLGNELLLSCPRPPPEGQALSTKTLVVMSRRSRKNLLVSSEICHLFVGAAQDDAAPHTTHIAESREKLGGGNHVD